MAGMLHLRGLLRNINYDPLFRLRLWNIVLFRVFVLSVVFFIFDGSLNSVFNKASDSSGR